MENDKMLLPSEVQSYIRHILHVLGMLLVARAGINHEMMELYVGAGVNLASLAWFIWISYNNHKKKK